jgi:mono/diheme cytochrome c family protein
MVALGARIYRGQVAAAPCMGCHGENGEGTTLGPPLTGKKWLWSDGSYAGIKKTIADGVSQPKKYRSPMPPKGGAQLSPDQLCAVAAYVWSLSHSASSNRK